MRVPGDSFVFSAGCGWARAPGDAGESGGSLAWLQSESRASAGRLDTRRNCLLCAIRLGPSRMQGLGLCVCAMVAESGRPHRLPPV